MYQTQKQQNMDMFDFSRLSEEEKLITAIRLKLTTSKQNDQQSVDLLLGNINSNELMDTHKNDNLNKNPEKF